MTDTTTEETEPLVIRTTLIALGVCVPASYTDEQVEAFANYDSPTGISSKWTIRHTGHKNLAGDPERVPCDTRKNCVHLVLEC